MLWYLGTLLKENVDRKNQHIDMVLLYEEEPTRSNEVQRPKTHQNSKKHISLHRYVQFSYYRWIHIFRTAQHDMHPQHTTDTHYTTLYYIHNTTLHYTQTQTDTHHKNILQTSTPYTTYLNNTETIHNQPMGFVMSWMQTVTHVFQQLVQILQTYADLYWTSQQEVLVMFHLVRNHLLKQKNK